MRCFAYNILISGNCVCLGETVKKFSEHKQFTMWWNNTGKDEQQEKQELNIVLESSTKVIVRSISLQNFGLKQTMEVLKK